MLNSSLVEQILKKNSESVIWMYEGDYGYAERKQWESGRMRNRIDKVRVSSGLIY